MEQLWYYLRGGQAIGPVSFADLRHLVETGELKATDSVRMDGTAAWMPANSVSGLFPATPPLPLDTLPVTETTKPSSPQPSPPPEILEPIFEDEKGGKDERGERRDDERDRDDDRERRRRRYRDDDDDDRYDRRSPNTDDLVQVASRAFNGNMQSIRLTETEEKELRRAGLQSTAMQNYAAWRRGMLLVVVVPGFLAGLFNLIGSFSTEGLSQFGVFLAFINALALFALPVTALIAFLNYQRLRMSCRLLLLGAIIAYATPILTAIIPFSWLEDNKATEAGKAAGFAGLTVKVFLSVSFAILAVLAGLSRGCVRLKCLFPMSLVAGWVLIFSAPLFVLAGFAIFFLLYQSASNILLILGMILWLGARLVFLWRTDLLTKPLTRPKDASALNQLQLIVFISSSVGILFIVIFMFAAKIGGSTSVLGFDKSDSLIRPWNLHLNAIWLDYLNRSLFLTVLFADLLIGVSHSFWRQGKDFYQTPAAADHDKEMEDFATAMKPPVRSYDEDDDYRRDRRDDDRERPKRDERDRDRPERDERDRDKDKERDQRDRDKDKEPDDHR
jgi:hypothetical protein